MIKFGIILPSFAEESGRLSILDTALAAENMGFESAWLTDHMALPKPDSDRYGRIFEAVTTLAYLAGTTSRIRLGISALVLPQRNPLEVAKEIATVDNLSRGRVILAVGIGWSAGEYANLGYEFHNRGKRMDEAVQVLRTVWRGRETISYSGKYYSFKEAVISPGPVQMGGPVLWVGGNSPAALKRAWLLADGWHPTGMDAVTMEKALQSLKAGMKVRPFTVCNRLRLAFDEIDGKGLIGTPEQIVAQLKQFEAAGMDYALLEFEAANQAEREKAMKRFIKEVLPAWVQ